MKARYEGPGDWSSRMFKVGPDRFVQVETWDEVGRFGVFCAVYAHHGPWVAQAEGHGLPERSARAAGVARREAFTELRKAIR